MNMLSALSSERTEYQKVDLDEDQPAQHHYKNRVPGLRWLSIFGWIILGALATLLILPFIKSGKCVRPKSISTSPCGSTVEEAIAAGCQFDPMMNSWLSDECFDEELSLEFRGLRDWAFYTDRNATRRLSLDEFSRVGNSWGTWEYHITHCVYAMRKLQRAIGRGGRIEFIVANEEHTAHCAKVFNVTATLMEKAQINGEHFSIQDMGTILHTGFPMCIDSHNLMPDL